MNRGFLLSILLLIFLFACKKDENDSQVPRIATDIQVNLNLPTNSALLNPGGYVGINGGSRGIIIYRLSQDEFTAFDRHCTYNVEEGCAVNAMGGTLVQDEECCESEFELLNGTPVSGEAERPLLQYSTQFNPNANVLRVYN